MKEKKHKTECVVLKKNLTEFLKGKCSTHGEDKVWLKLQHVIRISSLRLLERVTSKL